MHGRGVRPHCIVLHRVVRGGHWTRPGGFAVRASWRPGRGVGRSAWRHPSCRPPSRVGPSQALGSGSATLLCQPVQAYRHGLLLLCSACSPCFSPHVHPPRALTQLSPPARSSTLLTPSLLLPPPELRRMLDRPRNHPPSAPSRACHHDLLLRTPQVGRGESPLRAPVRACARNGC